MASGGPLSDRGERRKQRDLKAEIGSHRCRIVPVIKSIQGVDDSQGDSAIP